MISGADPREFPNPSPSDVRVRGSLEVAAQLAPRRHQHAQQEERVRGGGVSAQAGEAVGVDGGDGSVRQRAQGGRVDAVHRVHLKSQKKESSVTTQALSNK